MRPPAGQAEQVLNDYLYQRGEDAVVYADQFKEVIKRHLSELFMNFSSLQLQPVRQQCSTGRYGTFFKADGTVPIHHKGAQYNIPIVVLLPERYPLVPPQMYVKPTENMIIREGHPFVNHMTALVNTPCVMHWSYPDSQLLPAIGEMSIFFGEDPPLYTRPANYPPPAPTHAHPQHPTTFNPMLHPQDSYARPPAPQPSQQYNSNYDPSLANHPLFGAAYAAAHNHYTGQPPPNQQQQPPPQPGAGYNPARPPPPPAIDTAANQAAQKAAQDKEFESSFTEAATTALSIRAQATVEAFHKHANSEVERLEGVKQRVHNRRMELQQGMRALQDDRLGCEALVKEVAATSQQLQAWLDAHEWKNPQERKELDVHQAIVPRDSLARQVLQAQSEDAAIDDALGVLGDLLDKGGIKPDAWLKQVRQLSRRQFFARALGLKISQMQGAMPPPPPPPAAASVPPPPVMQPSPSLYPMSSNRPIPAYPAPPPPAQGPPMHYANSGMLANPLASGSR